MGLNFIHLNSSEPVKTDESDKLARLKQREREIMNKVGCPLVGNFNFSKEVIFYQLSRLVLEIEQISPKQTIFTIYSFLDFLADNLKKLKSRDVYRANEYKVDLDSSNVQKALEEQMKDYGHIFRLTVLSPCN